MADSVVEILNATITNTQLPNSSTEYTLLSTNSSTSYVIKDVQVASFASDLQAKINGFPVGNWNKSLSGSEVLDVSSSITLKSASAPLSLEHIYNNSFDVNALNIHEYIGGYVNDVHTGTLSRPISQSTSFTNVMTQYQNHSLFLSSSGTKLTTVYYEGNSGSYIRHWSSTGASYTNLYTGSYNPFWYCHDTRELYYRYSNELRKINVDTGTITTVRTTTFSYDSPSYSSYPRFTTCKDWLFVIPSNSYSTNGGAGALNASIYAIKRTTGIVVKFDTLQSFYGTHDRGTKLAVSYDPASDKFYVYRTDTSTTYYYWYRDILPVTKTTMDGYSTDQTISTAPSRSFKSYQTLANSVVTYSYYEDTQAGSMYDPDIIYVQDRYGDIYRLRYSDLTLSKILDKTITSTGWIGVYAPSATEISSLYSSDPVTTKIRITGVKTTA